MSDLGLDELDRQHRQDASVCPYCEGSDILGVRFIYTNGVEMFLQQCRECEIRFATEVKTGLPGDSE